MHERDITSDGITGGDITCDVMNGYRIACGDMYDCDMRCDVMSEYNICGVVSKFACLLYVINKFTCNIQHSLEVLVIARFYKHLWGNDWTWSMSKPV